MKEMILKIWQKWFGEKEVLKQEFQASCDLHTPSHSREGKQNKVSRTMLEDLEVCLFSNYVFRFNVLTEQTEFCKKGEKVFHLVDQRALNTFCMEARKQGVNC